MCERMHNARVKRPRHTSKQMQHDTMYACMAHSANSITAVTTSAAILMSRVCREQHYHGPDHAFVPAFVGFSGLPVPPSNVTSRQTTYFEHQCQ